MKTTITAEKWGEVYSTSREHIQNFDDDPYLLRIFEADCLLRKFANLYAVGEYVLPGMSNKLQLFGKPSYYWYLQMVKEYRSPHFSESRCMEIAKKLQEKCGIVPFKRYKMSNRTLKALNAFFMMMGMPVWKDLVQSMTPLQDRYVLPCLYGMSSIGDFHWAADRIRFLLWFQKNVSSRLWLVYDSDTVNLCENFVPVSSSDNLWEAKLQDMDQESDQDNL